MSNSFKVEKNLKDNERQQSLEVCLEGQTMGSPYQVKYISHKKNDHLLPHIIKSNIEKIFIEINRQMSIYKIDSEISKFNIHSSSEPILISTAFAVVLHQAMKINHLTQGGLNITLAPIINLWGFGHKEQQGRPTTNQLKECSNYVGMDKIQLLLKDGHYYLRKIHPKVSIDLCAIAKGFAVDKVAQYLSSLGIENYLINIGGEIYAKGHNASSLPWCIGIEAPDDSQRVQKYVALQNMALATSANYRNFYYDENGQYLCHLIDPKTYQPIQNHILSLSVIADNCMLADGLATALMSLTKDEALLLAEQQKLAIYMIVNENGKWQEYSSSLFQQFFI